MSKENTLSGNILRIIESTKVNTYIVGLDTGKTGVTYTGPGYRNFLFWKDIKKGDHVSGLRWKNEKKKLLDADSLVITEE